MAPETEALCKRLFQVRQARKELEAEETSLKGTLEATCPDGGTFGLWCLTVKEVHGKRFDRKAAELALGDLTPFDSPTVSIRVEVKPDPNALLRVG
jgi:hypothetical protein